MYIEMISTEHLSNIGKIKVIKKTFWHGNILNTIKKNLSRLREMKSSELFEIVFQILPCYEWIISK